MDDAMSTVRALAHDEVLPPQVQAFFDEPTNTYSYVVRDPLSDACAVLDPVWNFDPASGSLTTEGADAIIAYIRAEGLRVEWLIETHVHADHLSSAPYIQQALGGRLAIGAGITVVQETFGTVFNAGTEFARDGSQFDHLFADGEHYQIGHLQAQAWSTP